jgi:BlaI family transcriptional regulator, penicillinase repressor
MGEVSLTERELDLMAILWELGSATVPEVRGRLADDLAYTSVQTVLRTLVAKGYVTHQEEGRFHRYRPLVAREDVGESALKRMLAKIFGGSPELLLSQLVAQRNVSEEDIRRMRRVLDQHLSEEE